MILYEKMYIKVYSISELQVLPLTNKICYKSASLLKKETLPKYRGQSPYAITVIRLKYTMYLGFS